MASERDYITAFRFGFGLDRRGPVDPLAEVMTAPPAAPAPPLSEPRMKALMAQYDALRAAPSDAMQKSLNLDIRNLYARDVHRAIAAAATDRRAFTRRLAAFWSNHFSLGDAKWPKVLAGPFAEEAITPHIFGNFADLIVAAETHPAMILYLNLNESVGPNSPLGRKRGYGLNENLGREILELHSLGADGGYTQDDVVALAKLMTGWHVNVRGGKTAFGKHRAEPGAKNLLGKSYGGAVPGRGDFILALKALAREPACARFIARKLARHFFGPAETGVAARIERAFHESKGDLAAVYAAMIEAPEAAKPLSAQARTDFEFLAAALRAGPLKPEALAELAKPDGAYRSNPATDAALAALTQRLWLAPSPKGWPDDAAFWLSPTTLAARLRRIPVLVKRFTGTDPVRFAKDALGPLARPGTLAAIRLASSRELAMGLVLASPEFNRR